MGGAAEVRNDRKEKLKENSETEAKKKRKKMSAKKRRKRAAKKSPKQKVTYGAKHNLFTSEIRHCLAGPGQFRFWAEQI